MKKAPMNKKLLVMAATVGLGVGAFALAGAASAQSYGGAPADSATSDEVIPTQAPDADDAETPDGEEEGVEREGRRHREGCNKDGQGRADTDADTDADELDEGADEEVSV